MDSPKATPFASKYDNVRCDFVMVHGAEGAYEET